MKTENLFKISKYLLIINIIFWFFIAVYFSFFKFAVNQNYLIIKIFLFVEVFCFLIALWGLIKKNRFIFVLSIVLLLANFLLSFTDEIGLFDLISAFISLLSLINLFLIRKEIFTCAQLIHRAG